ncbi:MAG: hypothetical protein ACM3KM_03805 [Acidobacteriaceae bacterium]
MKKILLPAGLVLLVILLIAGAYLLFGSGKKQNQPKQANDPGVKTEEKTGGIKTYSNDELGLKFDYLAKNGDPIIREGDKLFVGGKDKGQWLQRFSKDPNDDLKTAVKKQLLLDLSEKDCMISGYFSQAMPPTVEMVTIVPSAKFSETKCPADYRIGNGPRYFLADKKFPGEFFFFTLGQDPVRGEPERTKGPGKSWADTFSVTK